LEIHISWSASGTTTSCSTSSKAPSSSTAALLSFLYFLFDQGDLLFSFLSENLFNARNNSDNLDNFLDKARDAALHLFVSWFMNDWPLRH
jgi:hypothetical protein